MMGKNKSTEESLGPQEEEISLPNNYKQIIKYYDDHTEEDLNKILFKAKRLLHDEIITKEFIINRFQWEYNNGKYYSLSYKWISKKIFIWTYDSENNLINFEIVNNVEAAKRIKEEREREIEFRKEMFGENWDKVDL